MYFRAEYLAKFLACLLLSHKELDVLKTAVGSVNQSAMGGGGERTNHWYHLDQGWMTGSPAPGHLEV